MATLAEHAADFSGMLAASGMGLPQPMTAAPVPLAMHPHHQSVRGPLPGLVKIAQPQPTAVSAANKAGSPLQNGNQSAQDVAAAVAAQQQQQQQQQQLQQQQQAIISGVKQNGAVAVEQVSAPSPSGRSTPNSSTEGTSAKLFVGGLSWQTSADKLKQYFGMFGDVTNVLIMKDPITQVRASAVLYYYIVYYYVCHGNNGNFVFLLFSPFLAEESRFWIHHVFGRGDGGEGVGRAHTHVGRQENRPEARDAQEPSEGRQQDQEDIRGWR